MDFAQYVQAFPGIQVRWKPAALQALAPRISCIEADLASVAPQLWAPWYANASGVPRYYSDVDARPVSIADVATSPVLIQHNAVGTSFIGPAGTLTLPVYALPDDNFLLLDGNHRAVAAVCDGRAFRVELVVLHGPLDADVLPDLKHWAFTAETRSASALA